MSERLVDPWVGHRYADGVRNGRRLLLVGDSHYDATPVAELTRTVVVEHAIARPIPFFDHIRKVAQGEAPVAPPSEFWHSVAFCNLVQQCMVQSTDVPTPQQFSQGWRALRLTVAELDPHLVVFFTRRGWDASIADSESLDLAGVGGNRRFDPDVYGLNVYSRPAHNPVLAVVANHPSRPNAWQGVWQSWLERAWRALETLVD